MPDNPQDEPQFGIDGCTCIPFTRQTDPPRYLSRPTDTVDMISGWERGRDCPHHAPAVSPPPDQTALRARLAEAMAKRDGHPWPTEFEDDERDYYRRADAALGVLPPPADRAAVYAEVADRLAADAEQGAKEGFTRIYRRSAAKQVREWGEELRRLAAKVQQPDTETPELPYTHIDDDGDKLTVGTTMAGTLDGEAPVVTLDIDGTGGGVVYVRPERVEEVVAALRAAGRAAGVPAVPVESAAADTSEETCEGCGHTPHLADQCQSFTFNERCECDEPIAPEGAQP